MDRKVNRNNTSSITAYIVLAVVLTAVLIAVVWAITSRNAGNMAQDPIPGTSQESGMENTGDSMPNRVIEGITDGIDDITDSILPDKSRGNTETSDESRRDTPRETETESSRMPNGRPSDAPIEDDAGVQQAGNISKPLSFVLPVQGHISKGYSIELPVYSLTMNDYRVHSGIDITASAGSAVYACADGTVESVYTDDFMGKCIVIDHGDELKSCYMGLSDTVVQGIEAGVQVSAGQTIAGVGETAAAEMADSTHLHFEMTKDGEHVDPTSYLPEGFSASPIHED